MNIVIPMAGLGTRFPKEKYPVPKPLIDIHGKPMIQRVIESLGFHGHWHFVLRKDEHREAIERAILDVVPGANIYEIDFVTEGPACTALEAVEFLDMEDELVIANCDQIMEWDSRTFFHNARFYDGCVVTYHSDTEKNSYVKLDRRGRAVMFREKEVISNISLNGIHYWRKAQFFWDSAHEMMKADDRAPNGEFYVAPSYNYMINKGLHVGIFHIPNEQHHAVGVPVDLERFLEHDKVSPL